jgi:hypothetical protein
MNKNSAKKRPTKAAKSVGRKPGSTVARKPAVALRKPASIVLRKPASAARQPTPTSAARKPTSVRNIITSPVQNVTASPPITPSQLAYRRPSFRAHKFQVGQNVFYTSSPISRPGASGTYQVVKLLPSEGDDFQYRIKHSGEAFERVAKESQLEYGR